MVQGFLKLAVLAGDLSQLIICVYLRCVDLDSFRKMLQRPRGLASLLIDQPELDMRVRVSWVHRRIVQKAFEILFLSKRISKSTNFASQRSSKINDDPENKERR